MSNKRKAEQSVPQRRRGRPTGKNRIPLSLDERRARNAQYERERRNETASALAQLAEAAGCDPKICHTELLATVISHLKNARNGSEQLEDLERINASLESQIASLQSRLGIDDAGLELLEEETDDLNVKVKKEIKSETDEQYDYISERQTKKRKRTSNYVEQRKRTKLLSEQWSDYTDSGIESQSPQPESMPNAEYETPQETTNQGESEGEYSQSQVELQSEIYRQIYSEESDAGQSWKRSGVQLTHPTPYYMETLARSLITIPSISPPQNPPEFAPQPMKSEEQWVPEVAHREHMPSSVMSSFDLAPSEAILEEYENLTQIQPTIDLLTEHDKGLIREWIKNEESWFGD